MCISGSLALDKLANYSVASARADYTVTPPYRSPSPSGVSQSLSL
jgi:hypothetical protein